VTRPQTTNLFVDTSSRVARLRQAARNASIASVCAREVHDDQLPDFG